jgi:hypothetical protein
MTTYTPSGEHHLHARLKRFNPSVRGSDYARGTRIFDYSRLEKQANVKSRIRTNREYLLEAVRPEALSTEPFNLEF